MSLANGTVARRPATRQPSTAPDLAASLPPILPAGTSARLDHLIDELLGRLEASFRLGAEVGGRSLRGTPQSPPTTTATGATMV
jgi:hypothetical protein